MDEQKSVFTLTLGDQAENHKGMEILGKMVEKGQGFNFEDLLTIQDNLSKIKIKSTIYNLNKAIEGTGIIGEPAWVLVAENAVNSLLTPLGYNGNDLFSEQAKLDMDTKAFMYGRVVNKHARYNLCFDDFNRDPEYASGKGRIVAFENVPITKGLIGQIEKYFTDKAKGLKGEGNYYYDISKCGIGAHGDSERRKVIAIRMGASMPIYFHWYKDNETIGTKIEIPLNGGDMYVMSEKAVGTDWKMKKIATLRHATGCKKFTDF